MPKKAKTEYQKLWHEIRKALDVLQAARTVLMETPVHMMGETGSAGKVISFLDNLPEEPPELIVLFDGQTEPVMVDLYDLEPVDERLMADQPEIH